MKRRNFLASAAATLLGEPALGPAVAIDQCLGRHPTPLPARIVKADVAALHRLTEKLRALGRAGHAGMPSVLRELTARHDLYEALPADDWVHQLLLSQLAELHTLAGWCHTDAMLADTARYHYSRALRLAQEAGDVSAMVSAATHAAHGYTFHQDAPNDALKLYQLAEMKLIDLPAGGAAQQVQLHTWIAQCLALTGQGRAAGERLRRAAALPPIPDAFDAADIEYVRSRTMLALGGVPSMVRRTWLAVR